MRRTIGTLVTFFPPADGASSGIDVVRTKIKNFAQQKVTLPAGRHKVVILDEADKCARLLACLTAALTR